MVSLLILSICVGVIIFSIHQKDEIHQILAFLSSLIAVICAFILSPFLIKGLLGLLFFTIGHKIFPVHHSLK